MARPPAKIDVELLTKLARSGLSAEQIGAILEVDHRTIERRFAPILKRGRQHARGRLQVKLFQEAMGTPCNTAIAIFLGKASLVLIDQPTIAVNVAAVAQSGPLVDRKARRQLDQLATSIKKRAIARAMRELAEGPQGHQQNGSTT